MTATAVSATHDGRVRWWWLTVPLLGVGTQACVKMLSAQLSGTPSGLEWFERLLQTPYTYGVLACEIAGLVFWMRILSTTDISRALPLTAISYLGIMALSWFVFGEPVFMLQIVGSMLILAGVHCIAQPAQARPVRKGLADE